MHASRDRATVSLKRGGAHTCRHKHEAPRCAMQSMINPSSVLRLICRERARSGNRRARRIGSAKTRNGEGRDVRAAERDATPEMGPAQCAGHAGGGGRDQLHRPRHFGGRQSADPRGPRPLHRRYGLSAVGVPVVLRLLAIAHRRHGRPAGSAHSADDRPLSLVACAGPRRIGAGFWRVFRRPHSAGHRRGPAISDGGAGRARLVQPARSRPRHRNLQLRLVARHGDRRAAADLSDAGVRLAHDVHDHGNRRPGDGGGLVFRLSQSAGASR